jgi:hypothetical protein
MGSKRKDSPPTKRVLITFVVSHDPFRGESISGGMTGIESHQGGVFRFHQSVLQ